MKIYTLVKTSVKNTTATDKQEKMVTYQHTIPLAEKYIKDPFI